MQETRDQTFVRVQAVLCRIADALLKRGQGAADPERTLPEHGFDSIMLKAYARAISDELQIDLAPSTFFTHDSIARLTAHILSEHQVVADAPDRASGKTRRFEGFRGRRLEPLDLVRQSAPDASRPADVAVVGMSGMFPDAPDLQAFWRNLVEARDSVTEAPTDRLDFSTFDAQDGDLAKAVPHWGAFVRDVDRFDAAFFGISRREAEVMDPQHRLFLENAWHAIEDGGYSPRAFAGRRVGVFAGAQFHGYEDLVFGARIYDGYTGTGNSQSILTNRVSYLLDLRGPSETVDTACSSSLVAIHRAVQAIQNGECEAALAGGVSLNLSPKAQVVTAQLGVLSTTGRCRTFDARADGYVKGEGVAVLLLKPLDRALADGDHVYGVIKGSAVNHGGKVSSLTAPEAGAQSRVIIDALERARIRPETLGYIEAHGTGTELGDPIEIDGIKGVFRHFGVPWECASEGERCRIGSLKTNIGHLEAAAGVAGVVKVLLALWRRELPPLLHLETVNPYLKLNGTRLSIVTRLTPWERRARENRHPIPRRAGVSSFGFGGTNAHIVLEEAPERSPRKVESSTAEVIALSAKTERALLARIRALRSWLDDVGDTYALADVAFTINMSGSNFSKRCAFVVGSLAELKAALTAVDRGERPQGFLDAERAADAVHDAAVEAAASPTSDSSRLGRALEGIAAAFVRGRVIDWARLFLGQERRRIPMPGYPFEGERFWIPKPEQDISLGFFGPAFVHSELSVDSIQPAGALLVVGGQEYARELRARWPGLDVAVLAGDESNYATAIDRLRTENRFPQRVIWCAPDVDQESADCARHYRMALGSLWRLSQALIRAAPHRTIDVLAVHVGPSSAPLAAAAAAWAKSALAEHASFYCRVLELSPDLDASARASLLAREVLSGDTAFEVRYDAMRRRSVKSYIPLEAAPSPVPLRRGGVYIVSGAFGALGRRFAEWLATEWQAKLVLLGRRLPTKAPPSGSREGDVLALECDVTRLDQVEAAVRRGVAAFGTVHGVLHVAGVGGSKPVLDLDAIELERLLAVKAEGVIHLDRATRHLPLDLFVGFSSLAAAAGTAGYSAYAAANGFLDGFMRARALARRPGLSLSIAWPFWADGAMGPAEEAKKAWIAWMRKTQGLVPLSAASGLRAFELSLGLGEAHIVVTEGELSKVRPMLAAAARAERQGEPDEPAASLSVDTPVPSGPTQSRPSAQGSASIERALVELAARILKEPESSIDPRAPLTEFGFDSLSLKELASRLSRAYSLPITPNLFFQYGTLHALADYLITKWPNLLKPAGEPESSPVEKLTTATEPAMQGARSGREEVKRTEPGRSDLGREEGWQEGSLRGGDPPLGTAPAGSEPIAVIGMAGVFPQSKDVDELWAHLAAGDDLVTEVPRERWDSRAFFGDSTRDPQKTNSKWGGFVADVDCFDAAFFRISPREAELMDPQHRLFLQVVWSAIENACHDPLALAGRSVGVFGGTQVSEYQEVLEAHRERDAFRVTGNIDALLVNRISYLLDLRGPSEVVSTACSSALVAVHRALCALRRNECEMAIVGAVSLMLSPLGFVYPSQMRILSPDGRCKTFDARANGYVKGEGAGALVLKPLSKALRDGDPIHAVLRGSAVNHGGRATSLTAPNSASQRDVILRALADAGLGAGSVSYVETHGTGTELGDPVEIDGLKQAFAEGGATASASCGLGSVKSNIGHLEPAAGIAGLVKVILALRHQMIPRTLHVETVNPYINLEGSPFFIADRPRPWTSGLDASGRRVPRCAGVSSFGFGGANAHVIVEEAPPPAPSGPPPERPYSMLVLSAKSEWSLKERLRDLRRWIGQHRSEVTLGELSFNLAMTRSHFTHTCALVVKSYDELDEALAHRLEGRPCAAVVSGTAASGRDGSEPLLDELSEYLATTVARGDLTPERYRSLLLALSELYCRGKRVDFGAIFGTARIRHVPLPSYPFEKRRHWLEASGARGAAIACGTDLGYYEPRFVDAPLPAAGAHALPPGAVLLFDVDDALAPRVSRHLGGRPVVLVEQGREYRRVDALRYELDPGDPEGYERLLSSIEGDHGGCAAVAHLWAQHRFSPEERAVDAQLDESFYSVLFLARGLVARRRQVRFLFGYREAEGPQPVYAAMVGFVKSVALEHPALDMWVVAFGGAAAPPNAVAATLVRELENGSTRGVRVRYSSERRAIERFERVSAERTSAGVREGGVYVITGGCGGLGLIVAEHLARAYRAKLVLVGRAPLDGGKERHIERLAALGAEVVYVPADVTIAEQALGVVELAERRFGALHGIVHAAGVGAAAPIKRKAVEEARMVLAPKVQGTLNLLHAVGSRRIDFIALFSSISSVIGNPENVDYAFANAFLDAFAAARAGAPGPRIAAISWPLWEDGGMKPGPAQMAALARWMREAQGLVPLPSARGIEAFERCLGLGRPHLMVIDGDGALFEQTLSRACERELDAGAAADTTVKQSAVSTVEAADAESAGRTPGPSAVAIEEELRALVGAQLKLPEADIDSAETFSNLGLDSISLKTFVEKANSRLGVKLMPSVVFSYETLRALAHHVEAAHSPTIHSSSGAPPTTPVQGTNGRVAAAAPPAAVDPGPPSATGAAGAGTGAMPASAAAAPPPRGSFRGAPAAQPEGIAIIGMSGAMPQSRDLDAFWQHLVARRDLVTEVPAARWDWRQYFGEGVAQSVSKWGAFHGDVDKFDADFFGINRREAALMDPQQRVFLEVAYHAFEDAGYSTSSLAGRSVGVFGGMNFGEYQSLLAAHGESHAYMATGNYSSMLANRISFLLDLVGPSETIDTACSSGLVALHRAVQALETGECEIALAGAASVIVSPRSYVVSSRLGILSPTGRCRTFDAAADGYVKGEGSGAVVLKPLARALADGDSIYGVIKGIATNHGGRANSMTAPRAPAQAAVIRRALEKAKVDPRTITYLETHGTGTSLGDPVEIDALKLVFPPEGALSTRGYCALGAVKTNVGHLEAAAGMAGLLKALLAFRHHKLPGNVHFKTLNPYIQLDDSAFFVHADTIEWTRINDDIPRRAGVSSFGFGGVNAHVVLEESPDVPRRTAGRPAYVFCVSARKPSQLSRRITDLLEWLGSQADVDLGALSFTLNAGRAHHAHRCAIVASTRHELEERLIAERDRVRSAPDLPAPARGKADAAALNARDGSRDPRTALASASRGDRPALASIADAYVAGAELDWQLLYEGEAVRRISIPGYPFERIRYWFDELSASPPAVLPAVPAQQSRRPLKALTVPRGAPSDKAPASALNGDSHHKIRLKTIRSETP
ncbi:SDR family NAD(P)-dependent oxidoreductase [Sorangium atrum]|uniref:SDR family NAD(P)-dependent oxidoreductase n=1 Tax=Sorangium atrum TaxID=2995308 RepID=A0ABT5C4M0_9BACT|nr:SDR family NAD(P)-dependent oxidoreductase [Sorangium aterium]MDC0681358.1 SDR family NAD(P)-dependent oxidoreductase [Sorangium aterium]